MKTRIPVAVHEIRLGSVCASIWQGNGDGQAHYSVTISRVAPAAAQGRASSRFEVDDLPLVAELMDLAHMWICEQAELIA